MPVVTVVVTGTPQYGGEYVRAVDRRIIRSTVDELTPQPRVEVTTTVVNRVLVYTP